MRLRNWRPLATLSAGMMLWASATAPLAAQATATQPSATAWTPEVMMTIRRVSAVEPSPDGTRVAFVVGEALMDGEKSEWLSHVHLAAADGSSSRQLTRGEKSATSPRWSPDGRWLAFVSSRSGKANVWRIALAGGESEMITDEKGGVSSFEWAPDGASIAFVMRDPKTDEQEKADKEKRDWRTLDTALKMNRLYVSPIEKNADGKRPSRQLTPGALSVGSFSWSPDGRTIVFEHQRTAAVDDWVTGDVSEVTVASGAVRVLASSAAAEADPVYSPDGKWVAFAVSDVPASWAFDSRVHVMPAGGGSPRALAATPDSQPGIIGWTADSRRVLVGEVDRVRPRVLALPADGSAAVPLGPPSLVVSGASLDRSGTRLGFVGGDLDRAPEPYWALVDTMAATKVATVQPSVAAPLGRSEVVAWKSTDGTPVEGILTYPVDHRPGSKAPLLVVIHGGPAGVFTRSFIGAASQYPLAAFAAEGYAVLRVNPRGSSGYGKVFRHANKSDWGGGDYRDIMTGVDHVIGMGVADPERLGVMGWSYGGFMTSWIVTQTKRFKAASAGAAVTNLMSFTGTSDIAAFVPDYFGGEYWDVFDKWRTHSAMFNVKGVTTPTLIQHGDADDRVPITQGYEFYNALKRQGVEVRMTVYPRQPHGFTEPKMTLDAARANLEWFGRHVLGRRQQTSNP
jgi:dipeptidyl aminopeptidase/acylaminoacyl peptidase